MSQNPASQTSRNVKKDFVHLHLHSDYSLLQSTIQLKPLAARLTELGMKACAVTDYGNMYGAVSFFNAMTDGGIKPIIGYEAFLKFGSRFDRSTAIAAGERAYYNLILLARDLDGYKNLVYLASKAFTAGFYYKPRIDMELLAERSSGLVALSGGRDGAIGHFLANGNDEKAAANAKELEDVLGAGNFYLEIQDSIDETGKKLNYDTAELAKRTQIPIVATNDVHYLKEEDARAHQLPVCIGEGRTIGQDGVGGAGKAINYLRSADEMWKVFGSEFPEALTNTLEITEMCTLDLPQGDQQRQLPNYPIPVDSGYATTEE